MKGYFNGERDGGFGRLKIDVTNVPEFKMLVEQARKEADQLYTTIRRLENFELNIEFSTELNEQD